MNMRGWIVGCCLAVVSVILPSGCTQSRWARSDDNTGSWRVATLHEGRAGRAPAREFLIDIERADGHGLFKVELRGINSHDTWIRADGENLISACRDGYHLCLSMALACHRIDIATSEPMFAANKKCESIGRDEDLILDIVIAPSRWSLHRDVLTIRSNSTNASVDLRRRE